MFRDAIAFNRDLSKWNVNKVPYMNKMFNGTTFFDQDLESWRTTLKAGVELTSMFASSGRVGNEPTWCTLENECK